MGGGRSFDRDRGPKRGGKDGLRVNREIRAPEVRVIDDDGTMLGVFPPLEALRMAEDKGLDLIEIAPTAKPPTCKITDYGKYKYEAKKKAKASKRNQVVILLKEVQFRPQTDSHDIDFKVKHILRFLGEGNKVKVSVRFRGREASHADLGHTLLKQSIDTVGNSGIVEQNPKMEGKVLSLIMSPAGKVTTKKVVKPKAPEDSSGKPATVKKVVPGAEIAVKTEG